MSQPRRKVDLGLEILEDAVLRILREAYPDALPASDICDKLGMPSPGRGNGNYLTDSAITRLEERGLIQRMGDRGPWRLVVT